MCVGGGGSGDKGYLFSGSLGALVIIFRDLGSNLIVRGIKEALQKAKNEFIFRLTFFKKKNLVYIDGSYRSNTIVNTEYPRTQNSISL